MFGAVFRYLKYLHSQDPGKDQVYFPNLKTQTFGLNL